MSCTGPDGQPLERSGEDPIVEQRAFPAWSPLDRDFDVIGEVVVPPDDAVFTTVAEFTASGGSEAVALWFGQDADDPASFQQCQWRVRVNGDTRLLYPALVQVAGWFQGDMTKIQAFVSPGETVFLECLNTGVAEFTVRGRLKGLYRPQPDGRKN